MGIRRRTAQRGHGEASLERVLPLRLLMRREFAEASRTAERRCSLPAGRPETLRLQG